MGPWLVHNGIGEGFCAFRRCIDMLDKFHHLHLNPYSNFNSSCVSKSHASVSLSWARSRVLGLSVFGGGRLVRFEEERRGEARGTRGIGGERKMMKNPTTHNWNPNLRLYGFRATTINSNCRRQTGLCDGL